MGAVGHGLNIAVKRGLQIEPSRHRRPVVIFRQFPRVEAVRPVQISRAHHPITSIHQQAANPVKLREIVILPAAHWSGNVHLTATWLNHHSAPQIKEVS